VGALRVLTAAMRKNDCDQKIAMSDTLSAAVIGAITGYLIARHSPEIAWIVRTLLG
jgi:hypothetical protein